MSIDLASGYFVVLCMAAVVSSIIVLWVFMDSYQTRQAFRWWSERQMKQQWLESEQIRNGVLQEMFTIRRGIELSLVQEPDSAQRQEWLETTANLQRSLEMLSHQLSPFFAEESLPLAIQSIVQHWNPFPTTLPFIKLDLPSDWHPEPHERNQAILAVFCELLRLILSEHSSEQLILVGLIQKGRFGELSMQIQHSDKAAINPHSREWGYISRSFHCLTGGRCFYRQKENSVVLHWQLMKL